MVLFIRMFIGIIEILVFILLIYFIAAFGLPRFVVNSDFKQADNDAIEIYILTNGVHTDFVLPIKNNQKDWTEFVNPADTKSKIREVNYMAFGWGDKGFYLDTPTWEELKFSTAFKAVFFLGSTLMHVTFYKTMQENSSCIKIKISEENYRKLIGYIIKRFITQNGMPLLVPGASYGENDCFYEAKGKYSFLYTCNTWVNEGLKATGMKACFWTPFDKAIFRMYRKTEATQKASPK